MTLDQFTNLRKHFTSTITLHNLHNLKQGDYSLVFRLHLECAEDMFTHYVYQFRYDPKIERFLMLFIELNGPDGRVLLRMSTEPADRQSHDMFQLFRDIRRHPLRKDVLQFHFMDKSLFASEWDRFGGGFYPFGFTLVEPPCPSQLSGDFVYIAHPPKFSDLLSLQIHRRRFNTLTISKDAAGQDLIAAPDIYEFPSKPYEFESD